LILQEVCADASGMALAYAAVDGQSMQHAMASGDHSSLCLLPCGLVILPDGVSPVPTACSSSTAVSYNNSSAGSFVSAIYQTQLNVQEPKKQAAHDHAGHLLCRVVRKIKDIVQANRVADA
jgi:homeobox-leucine zipper protein